MRRHRRFDNILLEFPTRAALVACFIDGVRRMAGWEGGQAKAYARVSIRFAPDLYSGGWVIPSYGYSVERIGRHVTLERAGNPAMVTAEDGVASQSMLKPYHKPAHRAARHV